MHVLLAKMNASSWKKAADLIAQGTQGNQQVQAAATADSSQLEGFPLSALSAMMIVAHLRQNMVQNNPLLQVHQGQVQPQHEKHKPLTHIIR